jgi:hypothetical protein
MTARFMRGRHSANGRGRAPRRCEREPHEKHQFPLPHLSLEIFGLVASSDQRPLLADHASMQPRVGCR